MNLLATLIIGFLIWPFIAMWRAYVIVILWGWFVLPITNIPAPSIYFIVGMTLVLALILPAKKQEKEEGDPLANYLGNVFGYGLLWPALALGSGWVWRWLQWGLA